MKQSLKEKTKAQNTCSSSNSQKGSIQSFFNGTAKIKKKTVPCPICQCQVELQKINDHIDNNECNDKAIDEEVIVVQDKKDSKDEEVAFNQCSSIKRKHSDIDETKKKRKVEADSDEDEDDFYKDNEDDDLLAAICTTPKKSSSSQSPIIKLSPSISYNPARFKGIHNLSPSPESANGKVVKQGTRSARDRYTKTPTKEKRRLIQDFLPDLPQHDPYTPSKRIDPEYVPYYVTNFEYVLTCVIDCTDDKNLFNDEELDIIDKYRNLSLDCKKLFVRLLNRKHAWIYKEKIRYDEIHSLESALETLVVEDMFDNQEKLNDIEQLLNLLSVVDIKVIAKDLNCSSKATGKHEIIPEILKLCRRKSGFFQTVNTLEQKLIKKAKTLINECYKINQDVRSTLMRVLCLWGLNTWWESKEDGGTPSTLTSILLTNQGKLVYPDYKINRVAKIFRDRDDLIAFEQAVRLEENIDHLVLTKDFDTAYGSYQTIWTYFKSLDTNMFDHISTIPLFLQKYTALSVIIVALNKAVDLLEKMKKYEEAIDLLKNLLKLQTLDKFRGYWYERLSLDLDSHLKRPMEALKVVEEALDDSKVRGGRRLILKQRAVKICSMKKYKLESEMTRFTSRDDWECPMPEDVPSVSIHGKMLSQDRENGARAGKSVWQVPDPNQEGVVTYCSVEEFCLQHFTTDGVSVGLHAEGSVFNSLLCLLFWDVIYHVSVPDVFRDPCQALPYDWDSDHFYQAREEQINIRLAVLRGLDRPELAEEVVASWLQNHGVVSLVNWDLFSSEEMLRQLVQCFDPLSLVAVMERMLKDHRSTRSGLPDLTLWNPQSRIVRMIEVKGPGDKLSTKQILWIQFLNNIGVSTQVCHVVPQGSKFISETKIKLQEESGDNVKVERKPRKERKPRADRKPRNRSKKATDEKSDI